MKKYTLTGVHADEELLRVARESSMKMAQGDEACLAALIIAAAEKWPDLSFKVCRELDGTSVRWWVEKMP